MALPERVPPQNIEAEQAVLGAMLIKKEAIVEAQEILRPDDFYREAHRVVFEAMTALSAEDEPVDIVTLVERLKKTEKLEKVGGSVLDDTKRNGARSGGVILVEVDQVALTGIGAVGDQVETGAGG